MRIAIYGTGGVGGYFGGRLAQIGEEVIFIARGEHLDEIRSSGLRVDSIKGDFKIKEVQATNDPASLEPVDVVLLAVKTWQVPKAARMVRPLMGERTIVVPLENGVEAPYQLAQVLKPNHVTGGLCKIISYIAAPGHICHAGAEPYIAFGMLDNTPNEQVENLREAFERAGVWVEIPADIHIAMWKKFLFIASLSGVGAVTGAPVGVMRRLPGVRSMLVQAMQEIISVAHARQIELSEDTVQETMMFIDNLPEEATSSMQRDILEGRPSELEAHNGAVVRMGKEDAVDTPLHKFIYYSLLPKELKVRGKLED